MNFQNVMDAVRVGGWANSDSNTANIRWVGKWDLYDRICQLETLEKEFNKYAQIYGTHPDFDEPIKPTRKEQPPEKITNEEVDDFIRSFT